MHRLARLLVSVLSILGVLASVSLVVNALPTQSVGAWETNGALPGAPSGAATVTLADDRMLVIGGILPDGTPSNVIAVYDAVANALLPVGEMASPRSGHAAVLLQDGRVLISGGGVNDAASAEIEVFDTATGLSSIVAAMTDARARHGAAVLLDGRVLIAGGVDAEGAPLASAEVIDLAGTSTPVGSMSTARAGVTATTLLDGQVLVAGGYDSNNTDLNTAEIFHAISDTFFPATTTMSVARSGHAAVLLPHNGGVLIAGGSSEGIVQQAADLFLPPIFPDPYNYGMGAFVATGNLVEARVGAAAGGAGVDGYAIALGGGAASAEAYRFATVRTDKDDYAPGEHALITGTGWLPNSRVTLLFQEDPAVHEDYLVEAETDGDGNFSLNSWAPEEHDLNVRFYLTVSDTRSRAQMTFTDSKPNSLTVSGQSPNPVTGGSSAAYQVDVEFNGNATSCTVDLMAATVGSWPAPPPGGFFAFAELFLTGSGNVTDNTQLTITSPAGMPAGTYTFRVTATPRANTCQPQPQTLTRDATFVVIAAGNTAPTLDAIGDQAINEGSLLSFTATATDSDVPAQALTFSLDPGAPAGAAITAAGAFTWTPTEAQGPGSYPVTVRVTDNGSPAASDAETITITVNEVNIAPVLNAIGDKSVNEGSLLSFTATASDTDTPPNSLTFSLDAGAPAGAAITLGGSFTWTPTEAQGPGSYPVTVRVTDNGSPTASDTETFNITVDEVNAAPVLAAIGDQNVDEGTLLTLTATATDDDDVPANSLSFSLAAGAPAGASITAAGAFTWTPTEAQGPGVYPITIVVTDDGSPNLSDSETINVTVKEVNAAPELASIGNKEGDEETPLAFAATATDGDVPANALTFSLAAGAPAGASITAGGAFTWTPTEAQGPGVYPITIVVTDDGSPNLSDSETINVTVKEVNAAPELTSIGTKEVDEETLLSFAASATDADVPANTLTFSLAAGAPAGASITAGGAFTWTPTEAQGPGVYPITIVVTDDGSPNLSDSETINVTVKEVNIAPVLGGIGNKNLNELTSLSFTATATDADVPANALTYSLDPGAPAGASITAGGVFTWTPTEAQGPGVYAITVRVTDNGTPALSGFETITVTVNEVNLAPTLTPIGPKSVLLGNTLNFTATATDPDLPANVLSFSLGAGAPAGASIDAVTGAFSWTPTAAQGGVHSITVRVTDNGVPSYSDEETITVTVNYSMCYLYDITKSHKKGSTIPVKLYLCDTAGNNVSAPGTVVNATGIVKVDASASTAVLEDSGNANPDFNFRYDAGLGAGGGYIFNLSTKTPGYNTGSWKVVFTVNGVASTTYFAPFDIR